MTPSSGLQTPIRSTITAHNPSSTARTRRHNPIVAAAISLVSVGFVLMASAMTNSTSAAVSNPIEHGGNAVNCGQLVTDVGSATVRASSAAGTTFTGETSIGTYVESLFTYQISDHPLHGVSAADEEHVGKYVNLSDVSDSITVLRVVVKGGDGFNVYEPPLNDMHAPLVGHADVSSASLNIPDISHWFLCYVDNEVPGTDAATTTTDVATTTTDAATTTTGAATTTSVASGAPTTSVASGAPTTTAAHTSTDDPLSHTTLTTVAAEAPIPVTGGSNDALVVIGTIMISAGTVLLALRKPRQTS